jgi:hypothetical protein
MAHDAHDDDDDEDNERGHVTTIISHVQTATKTTSPNTTTSEGPNDGFTVVWTLGLETRTRLESLGNVFFTMIICLFKIDNFMTTTTVFKNTGVQELKRPK